MNYIFFAFIAALGYSATPIFSKRLMAIEHDPFRSVWITNIFLVGVCFLATLMTRNFQTVPLAALVWIVIAGVVGMFALVSLFAGLKHSKVAMVLTAANTYPLVTYVLSYFFLGIKTGPLALVGIVIIILGLALLNLGSLRVLQLDKGVLFGLGTAVGWGVFGFTIRLVENQGVNPFMTIFVIEFAVLVVLAIFLISTKRSLRLASKQPTMLALGGGSAMGAGATFYSMALQIGPPGIVSSMESISPLLSAILAFIVFKEKLKTYQIFAILLVLVGVIILIAGA